MGSAAAGYGATVAGVSCPKCRSTSGADLMHPDQQHILELRCRACRAEYALESPLPGTLRIIP